MLPIADLSLDLNRLSLENETLKERLAKLEKVIGLLDEEMIQKLIEK